jgi:hypothetical protein
MYRIRVQSFRLALAMLAICISTSSAHAYLDPGTGSIILQVLLGGIAGLVLVVKLYWQKFLSLSGFGGHTRGDGGDNRNAGLDERRGS